MNKQRRKVLVAGAGCSRAEHGVDQLLIGFVMTNAGLMGSISLNGNRVTGFDL